MSESQSRDLYQPDELLLLNQYWYKDFFELSASQNRHLVCYWQTINNSTSKICLKFQFLSSHFPEVVDLLYELHTKKIFRFLHDLFFTGCKEKIFKDQSMSDSMICFDQMFGVENFVCICLTYIVWPQI